MSIFERLQQIRLVISPASRLSQTADTEPFQGTRLKYSAFFFFRDTPFAIFPFVYWFIRRHFLSFMLYIVE